MSLSRRKFSLCFFLNFAWVSGLSAEQPSMTAFLRAKASRASRNSRASLVHPGVMALGKNQRTTVWPRKSLRLTVDASSADKANIGAFCPSFSNTTLLPIGPAAVAVRIVSSPDIVLPLGRGWARTHRGRGVKRARLPRALRGSGYPRSPRSERKTPQQHQAIRFPQVRESPPGAPGSTTPYAVCSS